MAARGLRRACSLRIAGCRDRWCCRFRRTGRRARNCGSISCPDEPEGERLARGRRENAELLSLLSQAWPRRFAEAWEERHRPKRRLPQLSREELASLNDALHRWTLRPTGTEGYAKAEVTLGGVETSELSSKTMEAKKVPGLYFIGEVVDVTGWLGGYNFQWAWASGYAAGQAA